MAGSQVSTSVTIIDSLHGFMGLSLTEYTTSAAAAIAAGSVVEVAGAFFTFVADDTPEASTWTSITTGTTAYIVLTPSGTAGSQILSPTYTATAPTWRDDLQGWYASAASSSRVVASVYKAEETSYYPKYVYNPKTPESYRQSGKEIFTSSGVFHVPLTVNQVYLSGCAAGGNGGDGESGGSQRGGGGGGGGEIVFQKPISVTPGSSYIVTIGLPGSITSFGATSFNYGANGATGAAGGAGGSGGALGSGTVAGGDGSAKAATTQSSGVSVGFAGGGSSGYYTATTTTSLQGGGGGGSLGNMISFKTNTSGGGGSGVIGSYPGSLGSLGGGGGGGAYVGAGTAGDGGIGGFGCGGGGGSFGTIGGSGGSGGSAILIVEW